MGCEAGPRSQSGMGVCLLKGIAGLGWSQAPKGNLENIREDTAKHGASQSLRVVPYLWESQSDGAGCSS